MAGLTHTLGGTAYTALNGSAAGKYSLGCYPADNEYDMKPFHPPGVNGNYILWAGRKGGKIVAKMRYIGAAATILADWTSNKAGWEGQSITIVDSGGASITLCTLEPGSAKITAGPKGCGGGRAFMDCEATFTRNS